MREYRRRGRVGWLLAGSLVSGMTLPATAQASYTVFKAHPKGEGTPLQPTQGQGATAVVTLNVQDSTIKYVVNALARQAGLQPNYYNSVVLSRRISVHVSNVRVMDAIDGALRGTGLEAKLLSDGVTVSVHPRQGATGADRQIVGGIILGLVTDSASGMGVKGAQVRVEGASKLATTTTDSGYFALKDVPPGDQVLRVRLFGYRPAMRTVTVVDGERTTVRIALAPVPTVLSGVVTTAAGVQRKVEVGNDITTINVDSVMRVAPISTVTDLLETRVPGLTVQHTSGVPGDPSRIRIRGASSITGNNDPIVIVNGVRVYASQSDPRNDNLAKSAYDPGGSLVPGSNVQQRSGYAAPSPLDQIDPNSIETIEVFKGPSASALYGSDAANGVIVITTKQGRAGPTHWSLNLGQGVNWLPGRWPVHYFKFGHPLSALNRPSFTASYDYCNWYDPTCELDSLVAFQALNDPRFSPFAHGSDQTAALTVSGGVPTLQYSLTGNAGGNVGNLKLDQWDKQHYEQRYGPVPGWMVRPDHYTTYGVSGQLTAVPDPRVRVTFQSSLYNSAQQQGSLQAGITQLEGAYVNVLANMLNRQNIPPHADSITPPLIQNEVERATSEALTSTNTLTLNWQPVPWLPLTATGGLNTMQRVDKTYIPYGISASGFLGSIDTTGSYGLGRGTSENKTLTVSTRLPSRWITTAVGANLQSQATNDFSAYTTQLAPGVSNPTQFLYQTGSGPTQTTTAWSVYGWYVQPTFNLNSRLFASPGFRLDGGSASGSHGGFAGSGLTGMPKIDLSWIAVDQSQPRGVLSFFRPRLAFGVAGTQPGLTEKLRLLNQGGGKVVQWDATTALPTVVVSTPGNTRLQPETSRELEGGADAELWSGRVKVTATGYNKTRRNAIISVPLAPSTGGGTQYVNVGMVRNMGAELTTEVNVLASRALSWYMGANYSTDQNKVVRLAPGFQTNYRLGIVSGYPLFSAWARPIVAYADVNQNGIIEANEYTVGDSAVFLGATAPKYQLNLNNTLTALNGRLRVTATFSYQDGLTQNNLAVLQSNSFNLLPNAPGTSLGTQAASLAALCGAVAPNSGALYYGCSPTPIGVYQVVNAFRFNELSINYTLPQTVARWLHAPHAALVVQGQNLGLHTNYRGFDPNVNAFSTVSGGDQTADLGQLPQPRVWWLKLNLGN